MGHADLLLKALTRVAKNIALDRPFTDLWSQFSDEELRAMILSNAGTFKELRAEAMRRGIWDDLKKTPLPTQENPDGPR